MRVMNMSKISSLQGVLVVARLSMLLVFDLGRAVMVHTTRRDASKKNFKRALMDQGLPIEVVEDLSETYGDSLVSIRELVRSRAPW